MLKFNSRNKTYKTPFGAVATHQRVRLLFPVHKSIGAMGVSLCLRENTVKKLDMHFAGSIGDYDNYKLEFTLSKEGVYYYRFEILTEKGILFVGKDDDGGAVIGDWLPEWQLSCYHNSYETPSWLKGGVIYQIFPDRFNRVEDGVRPVKGPFKNWEEPLTIVDPDGVYRANDFYGGNAKGVKEKLPYLKELGVTAIYFNPVFESFSNHRYDTGDYMKLDRLFGTEEEFKELIEEADKLGIGIILDGVFNHTGADSIYFNKFGTYKEKGAYQSKDSKYYSWYTFQYFPEEYTCWWGCTVVPTISRTCEEFQEYITGENGVIEKWNKLGVKGWRLDVVDEISTAFTRKIRKSAKKNNREVVVIGEVWEDASTKESYGEKRSYFYGEELDGVMNYPFRKAIIDAILTKDAVAFKRQIMTIMENYPRSSLECSMTLLGTHDTIRILNVLGEVKVPETKQEKLDYVLTEEEYNRGVRRLRIASCLQYFLPGIPTVYYGDEIGMQGFEDPINRRPYEWNNQNKELLSHYKMLGDVHKEFSRSGVEINAYGSMLEIKRGAYTLTVNLLKEEFSIEKK